MISGFASESRLLATNLSLARRMKQKPRDDDYAAAHDGNIAWQSDIRGIDAQRGSGFMHRFAAFIAKDIPAEKMPHITASTSHFFRLNSSACAHLALFQLPARVTIPTPISATRTPSNVMRPPSVLTVPPKLPLIIGVISVPTINVIPTATPIHRHAVR